LLFIARGERVEFERRIAAFSLAAGTQTTLKCS
jgi:hypothetical protein